MLEDMKRGKTSRKSGRKNCGGIKIRDWRHFDYQLI
jgi:hypothetical protein